MIPLIIGAAAVGLGAALLSDDEPKQEPVTQSKQRVSEEQVKVSLQRSGRKIQTVANSKEKFQQHSYSTRSGLWETTTRIRNRQGIHARPASIFVQKAASFSSKIQLRAKGKTVDAKSILMLMSMGLTCGTEVTIVAEGYDARQAVNELRNLINSGFDED